MVITRESILSRMRTTLDQALKRAGLTTEQLAQKSGVSRATIYRLLSGRPPAYDTIGKLEAALGIRRGSLVFGDLAKAS